jgi:hypothetical protein
MEMELSRVFVLPLGRNVSDVSGDSCGIGCHRHLDSLCCIRFEIFFYQDGLDQAGFSTAGSSKKGGCSGPGSGEGSQFALIGEEPEEDKTVQFK